MGKRFLALLITLMMVMYCSCESKPEASLNSSSLCQKEQVYIAELVRLEGLYVEKFKAFYNLPHFVSFIGTHTSFSSDELKAFFLKDLIEHKSAWPNHKYQIENTILRDIREQFEKDYPKSKYSSMLNAAIAKHYILDEEYPIPFFQAKDYWDKDVTLSDYADKTIVLDFWATWCGPCVDQQPYLEELATNLENCDVLFIKVSIDEDLEKWRNHFTNYEDSNIKQWHIPLDNIDYIKNRFSVTALPRYMLIGINGKVIVDKMPKPESGVFKELILQALQS